MLINKLTKNLSSARRYAGNLYVFFQGVIGVAPLYGTIVLGLRLAHKFFMIAGFVIGLKSVSGRLDSFLGANFDLTLIPDVDHHLILILVVAILFGIAVTAQYFDLSLKALVSVKYGKFVQIQQIESIFDYANKHTLPSEKTAEILGEYSKGYVAGSVRRLSALAELVLSIGQSSVSALVFLGIVAVLSPAFGLLLFSISAIVVSYSIKKDYSRKIAVERKHIKQESQLKNKETLDIRELESILKREGSTAGKHQLLESINTKILLRQLETKKMKNTIRIIGSIMLSITVIAFLCFLSLGGIDIKQVPWMLVFLIYFAVRNAMADIRTIMQGIASLNQHYKAITGFLSAQQGTFDWLSELKRSSESPELVEDLES